MTVVNWQLTAVNWQLTVVNCQLTTVNCHFFDNCQWPTDNCELPNFVSGGRLNKIVVWHVCILTSRQPVAPTFLNRCTRLYFHITATFIAAFGNQFQPITARINYVLPLTPYWGLLLFIFVIANLSTTGEALTKD